MRFLIKSFARTLAAAIALACPFFAGAAGADCSTPGIHVNEVRFVEGQTPMSGTLTPLVELYNRSGSTAALAGWRLCDLDANLLASLPSVSLPHGAFLTVMFGSGTNDLDFSDGLGTFHTGGPGIGIFNPAEDAVALYSASPGPATIKDFVQWSLSGSPPGGTARTHATTAGIWTVGDHVALHAGQTLFSIRLVPDGYDTNSGDDWDEAGWGESRYGTQVSGTNAIMIGPADGTGVAPGAVEFSWTPRPSAVSYHLEVTTDPTFAVVNIADATTTSTDSTLTLGSGAYFWRVRVGDGCGPISLTDSPWGVEVFTGSSAPPASGMLLVPHQTQRKDSGLLCIWNDKTQTRPGCANAIGEQGPWDGGHALDHAARTVMVEGQPKEINCQHCAFYCARASVQMINHYYGGDLLQDRISYEYMLLERAAGGVVASPEGDLGHHWPILISSVSSVLQWAVTGSSVNGPSAFGFADVKAEVDAGHPMIGLIEGPAVSHVVVIDGYAEPSAFGPGSPSQRMYHVRDPWPGQGNVNGWVSTSRSRITSIWRISGAGLAGRLQEATVVNDGDGDGVRDFDEGAPNYPASRPRLFDCVPHAADSDRDDLGDKPEIHGYTFYTCGNNDGLGFPDIDGDGPRAEGDCDSDNGSLFDGGEDIDGLGICTATRNPFNASDDEIDVHTDKILYFVIEGVKLAGSTFHADTTYPFANIPFCPDLVDGQGIGSGGALSTNGTGAMPFQDIATCDVPKIVLTVVDVLRDNIYQEPNCQNPWTCWACAAPTYRNDLSRTDRHAELAIVKYNPLSAAWVISPDFMHTQTGYHAEMNGPGQQPNPINVALRLPSCNIEQGDQVFLTYWTAFFSQGMQGIVRVSTNGGTSWIPVKVFNPPMNGFQGVDVIDITAAVAPLFATGEAALATASTSIPILIEFLAMGPPGSGGWFLDDFGVGRIPESTVSVPGDEPDALPERFALSQSQPNPFSLSTLIAFEVPRDAGELNLSVFDLAGRRIRVLADGALPPGRHLRIWDGQGDRGEVAPVGIYFYRLTSSGGWSATRRVTRVQR